MRRETHPKPGRGPMPDPEPDSPPQVADPGALGALGRPRLGAEQAAAMTLPLQRGAGNAAVARLLARAPAPAPTSRAETPGHEEAGWIRPSPTLAADPVHVATIYFRTKEFSIDARDEALLKALATAYAPYAGRNIHKPNEAQGLRGRIVGYADPRPSSAPDNQTLSVRRAVWTADYLLRHLVRESGVIPGRFDIERVGGGVAPEAPAHAGDDMPAAEANLYAPLRRAEIYLAGKGAEPADEPKQADPGDKRVKPPNLDHLGPATRWDWFDAYIEYGARREIQGLAAQVLGWTVGGGGSHIDDTLEWTHLGILATGNELPRRIGWKKPPWWDSRGAQFAEPTGRGGMTERQKLIYKARLLKRDVVETANWAELHYSRAGGSYLLLIEEMKKDNPDMAKVERYMVNLEYLRFMLDETTDLANEVLLTAD